MQDRVIFKDKRNNQLLVCPQSSGDSVLFSMTSDAVFDLDTVRELIIYLEGVLT
jgi:hypothetical protein